MFLKKVFYLCSILNMERFFGKRHLRSKLRCHFLIYRRCTDEGTPRKPFASKNVLIMFRKGFSTVGILILVEIGMPVLVKVKGYTRVRNGRAEKVRSHYRRVWTAR